MSTSYRYIDLTHLVVHDMLDFSGEKSVSLVPIATVDDDGYANSVLNTEMHVGTHIDGPAHMIKEGKQLFEYPIDRFIGDVDVVDARGLARIDSTILDKLPKDKSRFLLICTGHSDLYGTVAYTENYPVISSECAERIVELGYEIVGLDTPSPDISPYDIHQILLSNGILILENLNNLSRLLGIHSINLSIFPLYLKSDSAPARVVASVVY